MHIPFLKTSASSFRSPSTIQHGPGNRTLRDFSGSLPSSGSRKASSMPSPRAWRPMTLQPIILVSVMVLTLTFIAVIEVLRYYTNTQSGFAFSSLDDGFSAFTTFSYLYLPTIVAVFFSMFWNWVDLDAKRLEPYFQLSSPEGASAENSLLLQYPFEFIAAVPFTAAKRRWVQLICYNVIVLLDLVDWHWSVVLAGFVTLTIFWGVTPLQNSMIATKTVQRKHVIRATEMFDLQRTNEFVDQISIPVLQDAWSHLWYGQSSPGFTTRDYALIPLSFDFVQQDSSPDGTVSVVATKLSTTLECHAPPEACAPGNDSVSREPKVPTPSTWSTDYWRYLCGDPYNINNAFCTSPSPARWDIQDPKCDSANKTFLFWRGGQGSDKFDSPNVTIQFCSPRYWQQPVQALLSASNNTICNFTAIGEPVMLDQNVFNMTNLEFLISTGKKALPKGSPNYGIYNPVSIYNNASELQVMEFWAHRADTMKGLDHEEPWTPPLPFALGLSPILHMSDPLKPEVLTRMYEKVHQLLFATAINQIMTTNPIQAQRKYAEFTSTVKTAFLVDPLGGLVEGFLGLIALLAALLLIHSRVRASALQSDPDSLAKVADLMRPESDIATLFEPSSTGSAKFTKCSSQRFLLEVTEASSEALLLLDQSRVSEEDSETTLNDSLESKNLPFFVKPLTGICFVLILATAIAVIAVLKSISDRDQGLPLPSENTIAQQVILNYLPIMFATIIEPFWTLLNRSLCVLQPFVEMRKLNAEADRSTFSRYTSLPPQLTVIRALKARHHLLALVCLVALSSNILSVSLGALFIIQDITTYETISATSFLNPAFENTTIVGVDFENKSSVPYQDHFYVLSTNLTRQTALPAWTSTNFSFVPVAMDVSSAGSPFDEYEVTTRGFGFENTCKPIYTSPDSDGSFISLEPTADGGYQITASVMIEHNGAMINCTNPTAYNGEAYAYNSGRTAFEFTRVLVDYTQNRNSGWNITGSFQWPSPCTNWVVAAYGRVDNTKYNHASPVYNYHPPENVTVTVSGVTTVSTQKPFPTKNPYYGGNGPCHETWCHMGGKKRQDMQPDIAPPLTISESTIMACRTDVVSGLFAVKVTATGKVLDYQKVGALSNNVTQFFKDPTQLSGLVTRVNALNHLSTNIDNGNIHGAFFHNMTVARQWFPYMMALAYSFDSVDPSKSVLTFDDLKAQFSDLNSRLGAIILTITRNTTLPSSNSTAGKASLGQASATDLIYQIPATRVFLDPTMYVLTMSLLSIHLAVAILYYTMVPLRVLPSLPTTIASQLGFFIGTSLLKTPSRKWDKDWVYGYGKFVGADGTQRVGIERAPLVQPLHQEVKVPFWNLWRRLKTDSGKRQAPMM